MRFVSYRKRFRSTIFLPSLLRLCVAYLMARFVVSCPVYCVPEIGYTGYTGQLVAFTTAHIYPCVQVALQSLHFATSTEGIRPMYYVALSTILQTNFGEFPF